MRKEKELSALSARLHGVADLVANESARNPEFAARVERLLAGVSTSKRAAIRRSSTPSLESVPDIYAERTARGPTGFRAWLRALPVPVLRAVIRAQDLDPARRTPKWTDAETLAGFIDQGLDARLARGSAFMDRGKEE